MVCPPDRGSGTNTKSYDLTQAIATAQAKVDALRAKQSAAEADGNATREKTEAARKTWQDAQTRFRAADARIRELETAGRNPPAAKSPELQAALERLKKAEIAYAEIRRTVLESLARTADYQEALKGKKSLEEKIRSTAEDATDSGALQGLTMALAQHSQGIARMEDEAVQADPAGQAAAVEWTAAKDAVAALQKQQAEAAAGDPARADRLAELEKTRAERTACAAEVSRTQRECAALTARCNQLAAGRRSLQTELSRAEKTLAGLTGAASK